MREVVAQEERRRASVPPPEYVPPAAAAGWGGRAALSPPAPSQRSLMVCNTQRLWRHQRLLKHMSALVRNLCLQARATGACSGAPVCASHPRAPGYT
jgi:hypothetical protein